MTERLNVSSSVGHEDAPIRLQRTVRCQPASWAWSVVLLSSPSSLLASLPPSLGRLQNESPRSDQPCRWEGTGAQEQRRNPHTPSGGVCRAVRSGAGADLPGHVCTTNMLNVQTETGCRQRWGTDRGGVQTGGVQTEVGCRQQAAATTVIGTQELGGASLRGNGWVCFSRP